jgi:hypothetical protein
MLRVRAVVEQQPHQRQVAGLRSTQERSGTFLEQPLMRKDRPGLGARLHPRVHVGAVGKQQLDELEVIHIGPAGRIVAAFDIAVVGCNVQRRPAAQVGDVRVRAVLEQKLAELIVTILRSRQQRRPAELARLIHIGAGRKQRARRFDVALARGEDQRRQTAPLRGVRAGLRVRPCGGRNRSG